MYAPLVIVSELFSLTESSDQSESESLQILFLLLIERSPRLSVSLCPPERTSVFSASTLWPLATAAFKAANVDALTTSCANSPLNAGSMTTLKSTEFVSSEP